MIAAYIGIAILAFIVIAVAMVINDGTYKQRDGTEKMLIVVPAIILGFVWPFSLLLLIIYLIFARTFWLIEYLANKIEKR